MQLASHLGQSLRWCKENISYTEFLTWQAWFRKDFNRPSRSDFYLMQIAYELRRAIAAFAGNKGKLSLNDFKLTFKDKQKLTEQQQREADLQHEKMWLAVVTGAGNVYRQRNRTPDRPIRRRH